eukprot:CAMPEP_0168222148 /NCGR_PEP_ID=MMETSP0140_2-20121125/10408_1 /TAXON_ID=44445 /ORGANISM="Pseudo-nitzschia australis, Strain 10249 10 AB" /LENGTH=47 /DNA_ID= /DNA_START= /DNA_END= /DNA_ORIENTATION=
MPSDPHTGTSTTTAMIFSRSDLYNPTPKNNFQSTRRRDTSTRALVPY